MKRPHAYRIRFDGIWLGLAAMGVSAVIVLLAGWYGLSLLFSMQA